jgi:hypothetical protein
MSQNKRETLKLIAGGLICTTSNPTFAQELTDDEPYSIALSVWETGSEQEVGRVIISRSMPDIVWQDKVLNDQMGSVQVSGVERGILWRDFEFGAVKFSLVPNDSSRTGLFQVLVGAKPAGRWASYPFADTFDPNLDVTIPPPFKVKLINRSGKVLHTFQMSDGLPINAPSLSQTRLPGTGPLRPFFNCGMLLPWQSRPTKQSAIASQFHPGFERIPESRGKLSYASNGSMPLLGRGAAGKQQINGLNHWHQLPRWPKPFDAVSELNRDPFAYDPLRVHSGDGPFARGEWITGWDYEPGSISGHDWYTGSGGTRFDRNMLAVPLAYLVSAPDYKRPKDELAIETLCNAWGFAYFNHSGHYLKSVSSFELSPTDPSDRQAASQTNAYYGNRLYAPLRITVDMSGVGSSDYVPNIDPQKAAKKYLDRNGNMFWGGWLTDAEHNAQFPHWHVLLMNSPMHIVAARAAYTQSFMVRLGSRNLTMRPVSQWAPGYSYSNFNSRIQAYRWMQLVLMWKVGSSHPLGVSRKETEQLLLMDLRQWHDQILVPIRNEVVNPYHVAIKRLGMPVVALKFSDGWYLKIEGTAASFYHAGFFLALKTFGLWKLLCEDPKAKAVLEFILQTLSLYSIDFILDTNGRAEHPNSDLVVAGPFPRFEDISAASIPTWKKWAQTYPAMGAENWIQNEKGQFIERYAAQHSRSQWAYLMYDWFAELDIPRLQQAIGKYDEFYATWKSRVDAIKTSKLDQTLADFQYQTISQSRIKPPLNTR